MNENTILNELEISNLSPAEREKARIKIQNLLKENADKLNQAKKDANAETLSVKSELPIMMFAIVIMFIPLWMAGATDGNMSQISFFLLMLACLGASGLIMLFIDKNDAKEKKKQEAKKEIAKLEQNKTKLQEKLSAIEKANKLSNDKETS